MTDIETEKFRQIAIDLINEYRQQRGIRLLDWLVIDTPETSAFIRSIQLHEKAKQELQDVKQELADFRQEVSDAVEVVVEVFKYEVEFPALERFIIPKPDPLVDVVKEVTWYDNETTVKELRAALDARGLEIREKNDGHS